ncbi:MULTISPECIES: hypothetical protein [unclassified Streptomyces]|uniref:hypothetical protein n=1 Tax=unclassified Streptomyces TaxID=2593676 RepID=UPI002E80EB00|nr:hypothetical protein [Streptomyces sp. NBC_00589]WTI37423.1 hypothetical protein OIC96_21605 [Streptomyces sp. NBC_00775]WUB28900.1 hypothetical protein OHA51_28130 [Streptomyces sp. NBC_00589]
MTEPMIIAQDVTEAVAAVLTGLARAYADSPLQVGEGLLELGNADRSVRDYPEQAGAVAARDHAVTKLLELARLPRVHRFDGTTAGAYDATQCRDDIRDGDVLVVKAEGVVGFLAAAWPVAITEARGEFHGLKVPAREYEDGRYAASAERAEQIADELGFPLAAKPAHAA